MVAVSENRVSRASHTAFLLAREEFSQKADVRHCASEHVDTRRLRIGGETRRLYGCLAYSRAHCSRLFRFTKGLGAHGCGYNGSEDHSNLQLRCVPAQTNATNPCGVQFCGF